MKIDPKYRAVVFDMDGTLLDTKVDYAKMSNIVFDEMVKLGVPETAINRSEGYRFNVESGLNYMSENGMANRIPMIYLNISKIARNVEMENVEQAKPFPGTVELLTQLHAKGIKIGVLTRGCREYCETAIGKVCGLMKFVDGIVARDDYPETEAKPSPLAMMHIASRLSVTTDEILYLGDHKFDWQCAAASAAGFVGVCSGAYSKENWDKEIGPKLQTIGSIAELTL
jgi:phosphoglycolate phosphatase-like HAD superfamily hydrolase